MSNINDSYFDGYYKDIWRNIIPAELTVKETDFMLQYFNLQPGNKVLDIMCGYGRHAIALAKKGINVTAVDNLEEYLNEINETVVRENLTIKPIKADIMKFEAEGIFDLALCMGNSLCFFDRDDMIKLLKMIAAHLKPGGHFFINTWMLAEIAFKSFQEKAWSNLGDLKFITESKYHLQPSRIETEHLILASDGKTETKKAVDYIYSVAEMELILSEAGFTMKEIYSIPGRKKFTLGDPRAYIVAEKL
ncbi:MAG TPA: class I SAM-dependent methyltransferase [Chitinophagaceae bacterium]|nr:class I SAM-dependent methyltransferase [Chitinophagaceae bacterium]